jgi:predicted lipoprotein with Yx(FWY)xxD motif
MKKTLLSLVMVLAACAAMANPTVERDGILVDGEGMALYIFKKDAPLQSNCYGGCAKAWPPFLVADPAQAGGDFSVIRRKDGARQWAYKGQPLYRYLGDESPGDMEGEGSEGTWYVVHVGKR